MTTETSLEPTDWDAFRKDAHSALDAAISHMQGRADAPVWQAVPQSVRGNLAEPLPLKGTSSEDLQGRIAREFLPYNVGNTHARFFGWVHGSGTPSGVVPEIFAAAMNANLGGRDHVANYVEKQVISWCRQLFDFPDTAGGLIVSGTSMATIIALKAAREKIGGLGLRKTGVAATDARLVGYASSEAHSCVARAFDILGLGQNALRAIPTDSNFRMDMGALRSMIEKDKADGFFPFCVVGTAGSVNLGAIDPLDDIADLAAKEGLWFHVDGAFGALTILDAELGQRLQGIERADSLAFDFHKWMHVNYDAGFVLVRDGEDQRLAFSERPDYLEGATRGLAAGNPWFCEYGPELSRGFRALKIWYHIHHFGLERIGQKIADNCALAGGLAERVETNPDLSLLFYAGLNITCFRFDPGQMDSDALDRLNGDIVVELQERGLAAPSTTRIRGKLAIRVNITNHRTTVDDIDFLVKSVLALGRDLAGRA